MTLHLPWSLVVGGSLNVHKMSSTHPNPISSVSMSYISQREGMRKNPFWDFQVNRLWPFNFQPDIFKFKYLGFYSSDWKTKDSSGKIEIERRHGEKPIFIFWVFHLQKSLWLFTSPSGQFLARDPREIFETWVFIFSPQSTILSRIPLQVTYWWLNLAKPELGL